MTIEIKGAGGGKPKQPPPQQPPKEAANTLQSSSKGQILDLLGYGPIKGLVDGYKSVLLDDTPLHNADGTSNFQGVQLDMRLGDPDQDIIPGFRAVMNPREINAEILYETPIVRTLLNNDANAVIITVRVPALVSTDLKTGDTNPASLPLAVHIRDGSGSWHTGVADTIQGKNTSPYERSYRVTLRGQGPFSIKVLRGNKERDVQALRDQLYWSYLTEVVDIRHSYPNCALAGITVDAKLFGNSLPSRKYLLDLSIIQVPSNYDPETRAYTGFWDGTFKSAWTDNPAWCFYDLATHPVIGAGIGEVNKWALYEIARYCDELVDDGYGGLEPRFTCNTVFSSQEDAITALNTLASVFRGMLYWGAGAVEPVADMPGPIRRILSPADVVDGEFTYMGTALKERHSVAVVMWNDPDDGYISKPEMVEDPDSIELLGWRELRITAVACTSRGQARRLGLWALYSEKEETQTCSFKCSVKHFDLRPGEFIAISDPYRAGARLGGLVVYASGRDLVLDQAPTELAAGWLITLESVEGGLVQGTVESVTGNTIKLTQPVTGVISGASFALSSSAVAPRIFRVSAVSEQSGSVFSVVTTEHNPNKYAQVENGLILPEEPTSLLPVGRLLPPKNIGAEVFTYLAGGKSHQGMAIGWTAPVEDGRVERFVLDVKGPSDLSFRTVYTDDGVSFDLLDTTPGVWYLRVRSDSRTYGHSAWNETSIVSTNLLAPLPPASLVFRSTAFTITVLPVNRSQQLTGEFEFWRSGVPLELADIESNATYLSQGLTFVDTGLQFNTAYYYYVRGINAYGTSDWVVGNTSTTADVEDILEGLFDEANTGPLGEWFKEEIGKIDGIGTEVDGKIGSITQSMDSLNQSVNLQIAAIQAKIDQLEALEMYDPSLVYTAGSLVKFNNVIYAAKIDVPINTSPPNITYWEDIGGFENVNDIVAALSITVNQHTTKIDNIEGDLIVTSEKVDGVYSTIKPPMAGDASDRAGDKEVKAGVWSIWTTISEKDSAMAKRVDLVDASVGDNKASIIVETTARVNADSSLAQQITQLKSNVDNEITAAITQLSETVTTKDEARGQQITSINSKIDNTATGLPSKASNTALSALDSKVTTQGGTITSQGSAITSINSKIDNPTTGLPSKASATALSALDSKVTNQGGTITSQGSAITSINSKIDSTTTGLPSKASSAALTSLDTKVTNQGGTITSLSTRLGVTEAVANNAKATAETVQSSQASTNGALNAMWGVKLQLNSRGEYVTAGIGLGISNTGGVTQSKFIVQADTFIVQNGLNGAGQAAFAVANNQVIIRSALIGDATITMAKIGGDLYSTNYVAGVSGWILKRNGQFEINSPIAGQGRTVINNKGMRVYDAQDRLRVKIGDLS